MATQTEDLPKLQEKLSLLETERQIVQTQVDINELTRLAEQGRIVMEAFGDYVNPQEYLYDDPSFGFGGRHISPISRPDDRADGQFRPIFENMTDLQMIRGAVHVITNSTATGKNILENLTNYTVGTGFSYEAKPVDEKNEDKLPQGLLTAVQKVIDTFMDDNDWQSDAEREAHWRSREDGEANLVLRANGWRTRLSFVEPDWILPPVDTRGLDTWLANIGSQLGSRVAADLVPSWSFGIHSWKNDPAHPLGCHVVFDGAGNDWDYFPFDDVPLGLRIGSGVIEQIKRNVPMNVKRGVSDFYPVTKRIERAEKLGTNVETTAAIQAAIAFIRNHKPTATQSQINDLRSASQTGSVSRKTSTGGTRTVGRQKFEPGTIIDTNGSEYHAGPMGQSNAPTFIDVIQSALRAAGSNWAMPEYMISADASNNNFASILIAGSPFVKAREADQRFYASRYHRMMWKVVRIAFEGGFFKPFSVSWEQLESMINIIVTPPDITIANELEATQIKTQEHQAGVLSRKTWIKESGRDPEEEEANLKEEREGQPVVGTFVAPANAGDDSNQPPQPEQKKEEKKELSDAEQKAIDRTRNVSGAALNGAQISSLLDIVNQLSQGQIPYETAVETMSAAFPLMPRDQIESIINPMDGFVPAAREKPDGIKPVEAHESTCDCEDCQKTKLPSGLSQLTESVYVAALESATDEERKEILARAWENYP